MKKLSPFFLMLLFIGITILANSQTWSQIGNDIDGEGAGDYCGKSVSLSSDGSVVAIGAPQNSNANGVAAGHVRIYENIEGIWSQLGDDIDGEDECNLSGHSISLSSDGSVVAIGAPKNIGNGNNSGHVRIYENIGGNWSQIGDDIDGKVAGEQSGYSVSLSFDGSVVAIGSPVYNNSTGVVRMYENEGGLWTQIGVDINGESEDDFSGGAISLCSDGSVVAIGANGNDKNGGNSGHVRIYKNDEGVWTQIGNDIYGEAVGDFSGISVDLNSEGFVVAIGYIGYWEDDQHTGHVKIYTTEGTGVYELSEKIFLIYPNPTNGIIKLDFEENNIQQIRISDITGKTIINTSTSLSKSKTETQQNEKIDLSGFKRGIYIISVQTDKDIFTTKIVKK